MGITFFSGTHPAGHKETTRRKQTAPLDVPPEQVILRLNGRTSLVAKGERVALGQPVAEPKDEGDVALHASVSGTVLSADEEAVILRNDGQDALWPGCRPWDGERPDARQLADCLQRAGVVGMASGDGRPTHQKLMTAAAAPVDTLIINGVECDSWHTADHRLLLEQGEKVELGARLLLRALHLKNAVLAIAGDKMDAVTAMEDLTERDGHITVKVLRSRYPLGEERVLTQVLTGRKVPPHGGPISVGCVVFNVATVAAVYDAVYGGRPLTHRIVTVTGSAVTKPRNLWVPMGTGMEALLQSVGGLRSGTARGWLGNPMRSTALSVKTDVVEKDTAAVVLMRGADSARPAAKRPCIRCGKCVAACPMKLLPLYAGTGWEGERGDCLGCGACNAVCPAGLPLQKRMQRGREDA